MNTEHLISAPIGFRFTHVLGGDTLRQTNAHWVKVGFEIVDGKPTGNIVAVFITNDGIILDHEVLDGSLKGVEYYE